MIGVGDLVVCVSDDFINPYGETLPIAGLIYTIRTLEVDGGEAFIRLAEIINDPRLYAQGLYECDFRIDAFRPVKRTDISIFHQIIENMPHQKVTT